MSTKFIGLEDLRIEESGQLTFLAGRKNKRIVPFPKKEKKPSESAGTESRTLYRYFGNAYVKDEYKGIVDIYTSTVSIKRAYCNIRYHLSKRYSCKVGDVTLDKSCLKAVKN